MVGSFDGLSRQQLKAGIESMRLELFDLAVNDFDEAFRRLGEFQDRLDVIRAQLGQAWSGDAAVQAQEQVAAAVREQDGPRSSARGAAADVAGRVERMRQIQAQVRDMELTDTSMAGMLWGSAKGAAVGGAIAGPIGSLTGGGFAYQQAQQRAHRERQILVEHMEDLDREGKGLVADLEARRFGEATKQKELPPQVPDYLPEAPTVSGSSTSSRMGSGFGFRDGAGSDSIEGSLWPEHGAPGASVGTSPSVSMPPATGGGVPGTNAGDVPGVLPGIGTGHGGGSGNSAHGTGAGQPNQHSGFGLISNFLTGVGAVAGGTVVGGGASRLGAGGMAAGGDGRRGVGGNNLSTGGGAVDDGHHTTSKAPGKVVDGPEGGLRSGQNKDAPHLTPPAGVGGNGQGEDRELKERPTWLVEPEETWVKIDPVPPAVIG